MHVDLIGQPGLDKKQAGCEAFVLMGFYVPGALGPPYTFSFMDPPIKVFIMVSDRNGAIWALCDEPILCCLLISISSQVALPEVPPRPLFLNPSWLPSWDSWALVTSYSL